jgi:hypothetical protein
MFFAAMFFVFYIGVYRFQAFKAFSLDLLLEYGKVLFLQTFAGLELLMVIISEVPRNIPYYHGELIVDSIFLPFLPRLIFPWKKAVYGYDLFWEHFINLISTGQTQQGVSLPGQFYLDFGVPGIVVGSFIVGMFFKVVYRWFKNGANHRAYVFFYVLFLVIIAQSAYLGSFPFIMQGIIYFFIPFIAIKYIYSNKSKGKENRVAII